MRKIVVTCFLSLLLMAACQSPGPEPVNIIPRTDKYWVSDGVFKINHNSRIVYDTGYPALKTMAINLADYMNRQTSFVIPVVPYPELKSVGNDILLMVNLNDSAYGNEGYVIGHNNRKTISIQANHPHGIFNGIQSFLQLLPNEASDKGGKRDEWLIPVITIQDKPRFAYRGMHLDVARHFFPVSFIKQYIDLLAMYKYNYFHWHLTEDQGWRIEIKSFPLLTETGSVRKETIIGKGDNPEKLYDGKPYGGYYTQEEVREVVAYAQSRFITVIPEIEMPGHSMAALAAYPNMGCTGGPYEVASRWGVFEDVYCTKDEVFHFLEKVLDEVVDLFPGPYVHIGGDEAPKSRWKACPDCQSRIRQEGLKDEHELQSYFIQRIGKHLALKGKRLIGWDEILEGGLADNAIVMSWRGISGGIEATRMGHDVIMTPGSHCYFDHYQHNPSTEPLAIGGFTTLSKVYSFEPVPEELNQQEARHIIGAQANVWTEYLPTPDNITYMILPRMAALSEVLWTPAEKKDWKDFYNRLPWHFRQYTNLGLLYSDAVERPIIKVRTNEDGSRMVFVSSEVPEAEIRYTLDGSEPQSGTALFADSLNIQDNITMRVAVFSKTGQVGGVFRVEQQRRD